MKNYQDLSQNDALPRRAKKYGCLVLIGIIFFFVIFSSDSCNSNSGKISAEKNAEEYKLSLKEINKTYKDIVLNAVIDEKPDSNQANIIYYKLSNLRISALTQLETESLFENILMTVTSDSNSVNGQFYTYLENDDYLIINLYRYSFTNTARDTLFVKFSTNNLSEQQFALVDNVKAPCPEGYPKLAIIGRNIVLEYCQGNKEIIKSEVAF